MSSSPHIYAEDNIRQIMLDVIIALCLPLIGGVYFFGAGVILLTLVSVASCVVFEYLWQAATKKRVTIGDLSAVVTGMLIVMCSPPSLPVWMVIIADLFAIIVAKQFFGGIGKNFMNPALAARAFLLASFPVAMTRWTNPFTDVISRATPLAAVKTGGAVFNYSRLFIGNVPGSIGETSAALLLLGALYLLYRGIITPTAPVAYLATMAVLTYIFGGDPVYHLLSGGVMLGAFFMATDYSSSPLTEKGKVIMGIGCGAITAVIRMYGGVEGCCYAILFMNILTPIIDKYTMPKRFGRVK